MVTMGRLRSTYRSWWQIGMTLILASEGIKSQNARLFGCVTCANMTVKTYF